jgi:osmotically inducible protein OsmC
MPLRTSQAIWEGRLKDGKGTMCVGEGGFEIPFSASSRMQQGPGSNPEELIGAAHAGCFSMMLAHLLEEAGFAPIRIQTCAQVEFKKGQEGFSITRVGLETEADVPGIDEQAFLALAEDAKKNCPVSKALNVETTLTARFPSGVKETHVV